MTHTSHSNIFLPTNGITIAYTVIEAILLILTIIIYALLCSKSLRYKKVERAKQLKNAAQNKSGFEPTKHELENHRLIDGFVFYGTLITTTFLLLSNVATVLYTINSQQYVCCARILTYTQIGTLAIAKLLCHLVFIRRLYITFQNARNLMYPMWLFISLYALIFVSVLAVIVLVLVFISYRYQDYFAYGSAILFCGDAVISIVLLVLFINRLRKVVIARKQHSVRDVSKKIEFRAGDADEPMLSTISRLTLFSCLTALASLFVFVIFGVRAFMEESENQEVHMWKIIYSVNLFVIINGFVNCMSLYLILSFAIGHYRKVCWCLHTFIQKCCEYGMIDSLDKQRRSTIDEHSSVPQVSPVP